MPDFKEILQVPGSNLIVGLFSAAQDELVTWSGSQSRFPERDLTEYSLHRQLEHAAVDAAMERMPSGLAEAAIAHNADGKPEFTHSELGFLSVAHHTEDDTCFVVVATGGEAVGCDIEAERPQLKRIANRFLNPAELDTTGDALEGLCAIWAAKEAVFKAFGPGLDFREDIGVEWHGPEEAVHRGLTVTLRDESLQFSARRHHRLEGPALWVVFGPVDQLN